MPQTKIDAFFQEFPWLSNYVHPNSTSYVYVKRIDSDLLPQYPEQIREVIHHEEQEIGIFGPIECTRLEVNESMAKMLILDIKGDKLVEIGTWEKVVPEKVIPAILPKSPAWWRPWTTRGKPATRMPEQRGWVSGNENVQTALRRLSAMDDKRDKAFFILSLNRFKEHGTMITVHKSPKGYNLLQWINAQLKEERRTLQDECAKIDEAARQLV